jgi:hypothetical protein
MELGSGKSTLVFAMTSVALKNSEEKNSPKIQELSFSASTIAIPWDRLPSDHDA